MKLKRNLSWFFGVVGFVLIILSVFPLLSYEWESSQKYPTLISPISDDESERFVFTNRDYTKAESWFKTEKTNSEDENKTDYYFLTIPKLKINNAIVRTDSEDLSQSLVHFTGTQIPGKRGNSVIFGHSVLPIFFNPENYISIFSTLYKLDKGDEIFINFEDINYRYVVESMFEVRPTDIQVLEQNTNVSYLSLITCTPPGDPRKPKRLVVRARIML